MGTRYLTQMDMCCQVSTFCQSNQHALAYIYFILKLKKVKKNSNKINCKTSGKIFERALMELKVF